MNNVIISSLTLFLVLVTFTPGSVSSVRILIKKIEMEGWVLKSANISCLAENIGHHVKQIVSIQLSGPGNVAIASLDYNSTVTLDEDLYFSKIEAEGNIQKETWKSYLTIVMTDILSSQSGTYTCGIHYFDREGFLRDDITSNILDAGEQDTSQVLLYMSSRISTLEDGNADRLQLESLKDLQETVKTQSQVIEGLQEKDRVQPESFKDLQETVKTLSDVIKGLLEKDQLQEQAIQSQNQIIEAIQEKGQVIAFTARYDSDDKFKQNDKLLFRDVKLNLGNGYNPTTGVFTAPQSGLYSFTLTVKTNNKGDGVIVFIYAKGGIVGAVYARDDDAWGDQSSISVTVRLSQGDQVYPIVWDTSTDALWGGSQYSVFTGYLVHGM